MTPGALVNALLARIQRLLSRLTSLQQQLVLGFAFAYGAFVLVVALREGATNPLEVWPKLVFGLALTAGAARLALIQRQFTRFEIHLSAPQVRLGEEFEVTAWLTPRSDVRVKRVVARLIGREERRGWAQDSEGRTVPTVDGRDQQSSEVVVAESARLFAGAPTEYRCRLQVPPSAMHTFSRPALQYSWRVQLEVSTQGLGPMFREAALTVLTEGGPVAPAEDTPGPGSAASASATTTVTTGRRMRPVLVALALMAGSTYCLKVVIDKGGQLADDDERVLELKKKAETTPFTRRPDGLIAEPRLVKFLEIRKRVFELYEPHQSEIEAATVAMEPLSGRNEHGLLDVLRAFSSAWSARKATVGVHEAQATGQAEVGMNDEEYRFLVEQVYDAKPPVAATASDAPGDDISKANNELLRRHERDIAKYAMNGRIF